jgi:hypothetical protein
MTNPADAVRTFVALDLGAEAKAEAVGVSAATERRPSRGGVLGQARPTT